MRKVLSSQTCERSEQGNRTIESGGKVSVDLKAVPDFATEQTLIGMDGETMTLCKNILNNFQQIDYIKNTYVM